MARVAADLLTDARALALDVGASTLCLAREVAERRDLRVFTNNLRAAQLLADQGPEVCLSGGRVRPIEQAVGGPAALAQFDALWFDAAVISVSGVCGNGFFDCSVEDADMKRVYFTRANRRIVLADSTKFNRRSLVEVGQLSEATDLVTEAPPPSAIAQALEEAGVRLHFAPVQRPGRMTSICGKQKGKTA
jgi:DeoR family glycerol-3-phosphate regulon repressor